MTDDTPAAMPAAISNESGPTESQGYSKMDEHLSSMRALLTCKICQHYLTEPYGLACGHTYCYICLDTWIISQKKRTCPECRAAIKQQPAPSLIIRELANTFFTNAELLGDEETVDENRRYAQEAAEKVAKDKADSRDGQLFKGIFNHDLDMLGAIYDEEDNVHRCPFCSHEISDGECTGCGQFHDSDYQYGSDEDEDLDFDLDDMYDDEHGLAMQMLEHDHLHDHEAHRRIMREMRRGLRNGRRARRPQPPQNVVTVSDDDSEDDESEDSELDSFIDDGDHVGSEEDDSESDGTTPSEMVDRMDETLRNARRAVQRHVISDSDSDEEDSDEDDDSESNDSDSTTTTTPSTVRGARRTNQAPRGRGPRVIVARGTLGTQRPFDPFARENLLGARAAEGLPETDASAEDSDEVDDDESSEVSEEEPVRPKRIRRNNMSTRARARATVVIDDDEDDETGVSVASSTAATDYDTADDMTQTSSSEAHAMYSHDGALNDVFPDGNDEEPYEDTEHDSDDTAH